MLKHPHNDSKKQSRRRSVNSNRSTITFLSLIDFIAAIHEMSAMVAIEPMLGKAFDLMGGTEEEGISVLQLH